MADTSQGRPYRVDARPGPGLARITDLRTGVAALWSKTLGGGRGRSSRMACADCGGPLRGGHYKSPLRAGRIYARLCMACVEGGVSPPVEDQGTVTDLGVL